MLYSNKTRISIGIFSLLLTLLLIFMLLPQSSEPIYSPFEGDTTDKEIMTILNQEKADMEDLRLIRIIREHFIEPPSISPYRLDYPDKLDFSNGQAPFVDSRLGFMVRICWCWSSCIRLSMFNKQSHHVYSSIWCVRENRRSNHEWTIKRHWKHWAHKTQYKDKQNKTQHRKLKRWATWTPPKTWGEPRCSRRACSSRLL